MNSLQQCLYPTLSIGIGVSALTRERKEVPLLARQGDWDGACGIHCAAMALLLLHRLSGIEALPYRSEKNAKKLWEACADNYFIGIGGARLAEALRSVDSKLNVSFHQKAHKQLLDLAKKRLEGGRLVLLNIQSRDKKIDHWTLCVGYEGIRSERRFQTKALLCLDPSNPYPFMTAYNGRLELSGNPPSYGASFVRYLTSHGDVLPVKLSEAVVVDGGGVLG